MDISIRVFDYLGRLLAANEISLWEYARSSNIVWNLWGEKKK
jgi:hypothetical protein